MEAVKPLVSYVILTRNRAADLAENLDQLARQTYKPMEVIVVVNGPDEETMRMLGSNYAWARCIQNRENLGVAGGRNTGMRVARGEIIVCVDDDASFRDVRATERIVQYFRVKPMLGVLAFEERSYFTPDKNLHWGFPGRLPGIDRERPFQTYYYPGAGHAIRATALNETGLYPERYFYSTEEKDLSYRMLDRGYEIWYTPDVKVFHKVTPAGRNYNRDRLELRNHYWFGMRLLPWPRAIGYAAFWTAYELVRTFPRWSLVFGGIREALRERRAVLIERHPVKAQTLMLMRELRPAGGELRRRLGQLKNVLS
jgi:GT2 family glycosyltransferase